jgi:hypothetical protein
LRFEKDIVLQNYNITLKPRHREAREMNATADLAEECNFNSKEARSEGEVLDSTEAKRDEVPPNGNKPQYPRGLTLYLVVIALMLSMFLASPNLCC